MKRGFWAFLLVFAFLGFACNQNSTFDAGSAPSVASAQRATGYASLFADALNTGSKYAKPKISDKVTIESDGEAESTFNGDNAILISSDTPFSISMSKKCWDGKVFYSTIESTDNGIIINDHEWDGSSIEALKSEGIYYLYLRGENNTTITNGGFYSYLVLPEDKSYQEVREDGAIVSYNYPGRKFEISGDIRNLLDCLDPEKVEIDEYDIKSLFAYPYVREKSHNAKFYDFTQLAGVEEKHDVTGTRVVKKWILWNDDENFYCTDDIQRKEVYAVAKSELEANNHIYDSYRDLCPAEPRDGVDTTAIPTINSYTRIGGGDDLFYDYRDFDVKSTHPLTFASQRYFDAITNDIIANNKEDSLSFVGDNPFTVSFSTGKVWDGEIYYVQLNQTGEIKPLLWNGEKIEAKPLNGQYVVCFKGVGNTNITGGDSNNHFVVDAEGVVTAQGDIGAILESDPANSKAVAATKETVGGLLSGGDVQNEVTGADDEAGVFDFNGPDAKFLEIEEDTFYFGYKTATGGYSTGKSSKIIWFNRVADDVEYKATIYNWKYPYGTDIIGDNSYNGSSYSEYATPQTLTSNGKMGSCWVADFSKTKLGLILTDDDKDSLVDIRFIRKASNGKFKAQDFHWNLLTAKGVVEWHNTALRFIMREFDREIGNDWWKVIYADNRNKTITNHGRAQIRVRYTAGIRDFDAPGTFYHQGFGTYGGAFKVYDWNQYNIHLETDEVWYNDNDGANESDNRPYKIGYKGHGQAKVVLPKGYTATIKYRTPLVKGGEWAYGFGEKFMCYDVVCDWDNAVSGTDVTVQVNPATLTNKELI